MEGLQTLVDNGHSWLSIKQYTLSEIGAFLKTIILRERVAKAERISEYWCGTHLTHEGMKDVINSIHNKSGTVEQQVENAVEIRNNWKRLASFMKGKR